MTAPDHDTDRPPATPLPDDLRGLTYETATSEQTAAVRDHVRRQLADLDAYWTNERRVKAHEAFLARLRAVA